MQKLELQWKAFNVDLESIESKFKAEYPEIYKGNQAASCLELWFSELPTAAEQEVIMEFWNGLTEESPEAVSYRSQEQLKAALEALKSDIATKTWNQLSAPQRKLIIGQPVTKADLIAAELL